MDRRIRKTKKAIQEALADLMLEKDLPHITVQAVADRADIHRATFYSHYTDVYDLYRQMEDAVLAEMTHILGMDPAQPCDDAFRLLVDYVYENATMCRLLLDSKRSMGFTDRLSRLLEDRGLQFLQANRPETPPGYWAYYTAYHIQGCLAIVNRWVRDDFSRPKEEIIRLITLVDDHFDGI